MTIWVTNPAETEQYLHLFLTETGNTQCLAAAARKPSGPQVYICICVCISVHMCV